MRDSNPEGMVRWIALVFGLLALAPAQLLAQESTRAVVIALDDGAAMKSLDTEAVRVLEPTGLDTVHGDELTAVVEDKRIDSPSTEAVNRVQAATQNIARGVESFFYMTPDRAIPELKPVLEAAWHAPEVLAFRPDLADQVWQAGIVLIRASLEVDGTDVAKAYALQLVTLLPSRDTDPKIVPPDAREVLEAARQELAEGSSKLKLDAPSAACALYINGAPAKPQTNYTIDPAGKYFVHADCALASAPPIWRVDAGRPADLVVLVPAVPPQDFRMAGSTAEDRRVAEWYLRAGAQFVDADIAVGVGSPRGDDDSVVLARYDRKEHTVTWSDADYTDSIRRGMPVIFPEYAAVFQEDVKAARPAKKLDILGITAVSGGAVLSGVGVVLLVSAGRQAHLLDCAVNNPDPPGGDCSDVPPDTYFDDFSRETRKVGSVRTGGWVMVGVGAVAIGYGVYRLLRPAPSPPEGGLAFSGTGMVYTW